MAQQSKQTYDYICFSDLAYESVFTDAIEIEHKIKRRLKYYNLARYDQERVDAIRKLKNDLQEEISLHSKSKYYNKSRCDYADLADFNLAKMKADLLKRYPKITDLDMTQILNFAVYLYYLR